MKEITLSHPLSPRDLIFLGMAGDHQTEQIARTACFYERDLLEEIHRLLPTRRGIVLDVGACLGNHTLFFAGVMGRQVVAIEPALSNVEILSAMLAVNDLSPKVEIVMTAAGNRERLCSIERPKLPNLGAGRTCRPGQPALVKRLDDIYKSSRFCGEPVALIKIDVEGDEASVIEGALETIKQFRPVIAVECASKADFDTNNALLAPLSYVLVREKPFCATPTYLFERGFQ